MIAATLPQGPVVLPLPCGIAFALWYCLCPVALARLFIHCQWLDTVSSRFCLFWRNGNEIGLSMYACAVFVKRLCLSVDKQRNYPNLHGQWTSSSRCTPVTATHKTRTKGPSECETTPPVGMGLNCCNVLQAVVSLVTWQMNIECTNLIWLFISCRLCVC